MQVHNVDGIDVGAADAVITKYVAGRAVDVAQSAFMLS